MNILTKISRRGQLAGAAALALSVGLAACDTDSIVEIEDPDGITGIPTDPALLPAIVNGAIGEFAVAYSGPGGDGFLSVTGVMSDELFSSGTFTTRTATDRRDQFPIQSGNTSDGTYINLQQARYALRVASDRLAETEDGTADPDYALTRALEAYTIVAMAEAYCGAIPLSFPAEGPEVEDAYEYGVSFSRSELLAEAARIFDEAIVTGNSVELAAVGLGRARLNEGDYDGAAEAVADVPTTFVYHINHSVNSEQNPIFSLQDNGRYSVSDAEGINGVDFRSADDPRVQWFDDGGGFDAGIPLYFSTRYTGFEAPVLLASGVEARLIEAEAALNATPGDASAMLTILNDLRSEVADLMTLIQPDYQADADYDNIWPGREFIGTGTLDPLTDAGSFEANRDQLFRERAMWLFLTGHRLGDLRRLVLNYGANGESVYPTGEYHKGGTYGEDLVMPLDFNEQNHPDWDESRCDVLDVG